MRPRRSHRRRRLVLLGALSILGVLSLSLLALIQRQVAGETAAFREEREKTLKGRLRVAWQDFRELERAALAELERLVVAPAESGELDPTELERSHAVVRKVFVVVGDTLRWPRTLERDTLYGERVGQAAMDSTLDRQLLGRVYASMASGDPAPATLELQNVLRRSLTPRARAEAELLLANLLATRAHDLEGAIACCDRVIAGETSSPEARSGELLPWTLAALQRKGALLIERGDAPAATRTLLDLLERVTRPGFFSRHDEYTAFYRGRAMNALSELRRNGELSDRDEAEILRLRRLASELEAEVAFRADMDRLWLPAVRAARFRHGDSSPVRHVYLYADDTPSLLAYRDESETSGRVFGFTVRMSTLRDELLGSLGSDAGGFAAPTRILDSRQRPLFAEAAVAARESGDLVSAGLPAEIPWTAEWDIGDELAAFRSERLGLYGGVFVLALLLVSFALWATVKGLNRQMELAELKSQFVANVSHELKTPLTLIRMYAELSLLGYTRGREEAAKNLQLIAREAENLTLLIDNVLDLSRIEAGEKSYQPAPVEPGELITSIVDDFRPYTERKGFEAKLEIEPDLPTLPLDASAFSQALRNLLSNAVKYSSDRKVLEVSARCAKTGGSANGEPGKAAELVVEVADRGLGFPPRHAERLFERFFRSLPDAEGHRPAGTGIGLAIVKHVAESHGGAVRARNREGGGSVFTMTFPIEREKGIGSPFSPAVLP